MKPAIHVNEIQPEPAHYMPEPFASRLGPYEGKSLGDYFGLNGLGIRLDTIRPECQSALRHWHTLSEEFVYVLEGVLTLVTDDGESILTRGMCVGFRAGVPNAHHLVNRADQVARILVVGTRADEDEVHYPDDDLQWMSDGQGDWHPAKKDGTKYPGRDSAPR